MSKLVSAHALWTSRLFTVSLYAFKYWFGINTLVLLLLDTDSIVFLQAATKHIWQTSSIWGFPVKNVLIYPLVFLVAFISDKTFCLLMCTIIQYEWMSGECTFWVCGGTLSIYSCVFSFLRPFRALSCVLPCSNFVYAVPLMKLYQHAQLAVLGTIWLPNHTAVTVLVLASWNDIFASSFIKE